MSNLYILGYKNGSSVESWRASTFTTSPPPPNVKLSRKQLEKYGFREAGNVDYYIARRFGLQPPLCDLATDEPGEPPRCIHCLSLPANYGPHAIPRVCQNPPKPKDS